MEKGQPVEGDRSIFVEFFGGTPLFRVLDFLVENRGLDYSKTEIAKGSGIGWSTLYKIWDKLEDEGIVRKTRAYGNTKLYTLNTENPIVQKLIKIEWDLIKHHAEEVEEKPRKDLVVARAT